jgi:hypothetical protein
MNGKRKSLFLISIGVLNLLHGFTHIIQLVQSMLLVAYASEHNHEEGFVHGLLHNPVLALIWAAIGIVTVVIGIKDYRHHNKCHKSH